MIVTVTVNPSIDRTIELASPLERGAVLRAVGVRNEPGGKGINVSRVIAEAGLDTLALLPSAPGDRMLVELDAVGLPHHAVGIDGEVRVNITIAEPDGTTTKLNEAGCFLGTGQIEELTDLIVTSAAEARWLALCGSLAPGLDDDWYRGIIDRLAGTGCRIAVDTSDGPLAEVARSTPSLLKPNGEELASLTGADGRAMEAAAEAGDPGAAAEAARNLSATTGAAVLNTLGAAGAVLADGDQSWFATPPPIVPRSTVGAGDSSLAGYLIAETRGLEPAERLRTAVAYGSAAAALPGTQPPTPAQLDLAGVTIRQLSS